MDLTTAQWIVALLAAFLVGLTKTGVAGLGILIAPLMASLFDAEHSKQSVGALLPMLIFADLFAVTYFRRHAQWRLLFRLLPWVLPGLVAGYLCLGRLSGRQFTPFLGWMVMAIIAMNVVRERGGAWLEEHLPHQWWFSAVMGFLAGFATTVGNVAGPIMSVYLLSMGLAKREFMGTGAWYYLIVNCLKVPLFGHLGLITSPSLLLNLKALPVIAIGALVGMVVFQRISQAWFNRLIIVLAAAAALKLALSPWIGG